jgi:hypothetical protein
VIQTAEADIISPSVSAERPLGLLGQELLVIYDVASSSLSTFSRAATSFVVASEFAAPSSKVSRYSSHAAVSSADALP